MSEGPNTPGSAPAQGRHDLPAEPLRLPAAPPGATLRRGRLAWHRGVRGRPFVAVEVRCPLCGTPHLHPWRWDWGLAADVVSLQAALCWRGLRRPYWVGLDPASAEENARVHAEAHEAFAAWEMDRATRRGQLTRSAPAPRLVGLHMPPVGQGGSRRG